jgi:hypothetical protein
VPDADPPSAVPPVSVALPRVLRLAASPNPSAGAISFVLDLAVAGAARVEVFDLTGRRVASTPYGQLAAGRHSLSWDGRGADGVPVAPGVYLARVRAGDLTASARFVRVK